LGAVIYKSVNKNFTNLVESSLDPESSSYKKVSASWEVGFSDYVLAVGSDELEDAKIISDPEKIQEMKGFLRSYGGTGKTDTGESIYRLIKGQIYPLGIAYTLNPAAEVKGLYSEKPEVEKVFINDKRDKISQKINLNVNTTKDINAMEIEQTISELKELLNEKKFSKEAAASMTETFEQAIKKRDEQYRADLEVTKSEKAAIAKEYEDLKTSVAELEEKLGSANERISLFENEKKAEEAVARFNERMDSLDQSYDLDDQDREFLAKELKSIGEEEEFSSFASKLEVLWKHKNKEAQAAFNEEIQSRIDEEVSKRISNASTEKVEVEEALDGAEEVNAGVPNVNEAIASKEESLIDKFKGAFKRENIEIS
jgi:chromosome segregation ATPase